MGENQAKNTINQKEVFLKKVIEKAKKLFSNFFVTATVVFLLWITFFDSNNFIHQRRLKQKLRELQEEKAFYEREIRKMQEDLKELNSSPSQLEKFARERYRFKKPGEDVFIIEEKKK